MRTPEQVQWDFVQQWLAKARQDLRVAEVLLRGDPFDHLTSRLFDQLTSLLAAASCQLPAAAWLS